MSPDRAIAHLARRQHALVTLEQLFKAGVTESHIRHRKKSGQLEVARPRVLRLAGSPETPQAVLAAVWLSAGQRSAFISGPSAAWLWGITDSESTTPIFVTTPMNRSVRLPGVVAVRSAGTSGVTRRSGIRCSDPTRLLFELAAAGEGPESIERAFDALLNTRAISLAHIERALGECGGRGVSGTRILRKIVDDRTIGSKLSDSRLETTFAELLDRFGIHGFIFHERLRIGGRWFEPDFCHPEARLLIELDGFQHHGVRSAFEADRRRDAVTAAAGWLTLRFTWRRVTDEAPKVAKEVAAVINQRIAM